MDWRTIETAPKDGTVVRYRRVLDGKVAYEGFACWRTVHFDALPPHPISGEVFAPAEDATGWMWPDRDKRVPTPTHWAPTE